VFANPALRFCAEATTDPAVGIWNYRSRISRCRRHHSRPCTKRKDGAPFFVVVSTKFKGWATRPVWGCPDSQSYTSRSITISLPYAALPSDIQATVTSQIDALTVTAASSYNRILGNLSGLGLPLLGLLNKSSVNIFFDPSGGGMVGASFGYNTSTQNATSNVSISYSYYFQTFPEGDASFE
jgi:hypothetical protein